MKSENYIVIQGWMRTELNLKGNDLLVYAIIYGFSQTENQKFTGSIQYLADWCGATRQGIQKNLNNLLELGLIVKEKNEVYNSVTYCTTQLSDVQLSLHNNIDNNITNNKEVNNISKDILLQENMYDDVSDKLYSNDKPKKKKNLYEKCLDVIYEYTDDLELQDLLVTFLKMRLEVKDKPLYFNMWKGLLKKLFSMSDKLDDLCNIVQQSIDKGWLSFYNVNSSPKKKDIQKVSSEFGVVSCNKIDDEELLDDRF